jgi:hemerythrin superfamily protein
MLATLGTAEAMTDLFESLSSEHRAVEDLFAAFEKDHDDATAREICDALTLHTEVEEQVLYPELRRIVDDGDDLANLAEDEHGAVRALIARVYEAPPIDLAPLIDEMRQLVERHVQSEETGLFPRLREAGADPEALGARAEAARGEATSRSSGQVG